MESNNNNTKKSYSDMNCIWMTSGLVKYKLCDKEFDCENCEFDRVFRNLSAKIDDKSLSSDPYNGDLIEKFIKRIENVHYDYKLIYLRNQLVMKNLFGNAYYLGINPIILYLMDDFNSMHEFHSNEIKRDQVIFTFEGNWGIKQFCSPINFMIIEKINSSQFKTNQWYSLILFNQPEDDYVRLTKDEWMKQKESVLSVLKEQLAKKPNIGQSMLDGGTKINQLYQYLGKREYLRLLNQAFL
ncbi:MAG: hypothetical protein R6W90_05790 [Ignavibacteriaceae bacterium]